MRILITGPESTGKSSLGLALSEATGIIYVPEIARSYIGGLEREYGPEDIETIAKLNIQSVKELGQNSFIHDTYLLNLIIWMKVKFGTLPSWIELEWSKANFDLVLLCYPDLEWEEDPLRESPNSRMQLYQLFEEGLSNISMPIGIIKGMGSQRIQNAIDIINQVQKS